LRTHISIFASGSGTNAEKLLSYFSEHPVISVNGVFTNKENAGVRDIAKNYGVPVYYYPNPVFEEGLEILSKLQEIKTDYIILAGFLRKIPENLIAAYADKIVNIHPSLLPRHGGQNMYGKRVHEAVKASGDQQTGITIHLVNEEYDKGRILDQFACPVSPEMTVDDIAAAVQTLEHNYYKTTIEKLIQDV
jgi:phosphoribosylglycinamide formyltransferase-1